MYDVQELEKRWIAYNRKKKKSLYIGVTLSIALLTIGALLYIKQDEIMSLANSNQTTQQMAQVLTDQNVSKQNEIKKPVLLSENTSQITTENKIIDEKPYDRAGNVPVLEDVESLAADDLASENDTNQKHEKVKLDIQMIDVADAKAFDVVEKRFYENGDVDDAMFLARSYFANKNYQKAEYWALQANKTNESLEEAWLLFSESKYHLGKKQEAVKVLESYLEKKDSLQAKQLLKKFKGE